MNSPQPDHEAAKEAAEELLQWESWTADPLMDKWQLVARAYLALSRRVEEAEKCRAILKELINALPSAEFMRANGQQEGPMLARARAALSEASQNE